MKIANNIEEIKNWAEKIQPVPYSNIKILYANDYWDGPLEGLLLWNKQEYYFICYNDPTHEHEVERRYVIIEMTEEQASEEKYYHQLFINHVGNHFEYNNLGKQNLTPVTKSKEEQQKFYSEYEKAKKYTINQSQIK